MPQRVSVLWSAVGVVALLLLIAGAVLTGLGASGNPTIELGDNTIKAAGAGPVLLATGAFLFWLIGKYTGAGKAEVGVFGGAGAQAPSAWERFLGWSARYAWAPFLLGAIFAALYFLKILPRG